MGLELLRNKDTIRCAALGMKVPGHRQKQMTQTPIVFVENASVFVHPLYDPPGSKSLGSFEWGEAFLTCFFFRNPSG